MLCLVAALAVKLAYAFPPDVARAYEVQTVFEGFIPLLGGHEGKVEVNLVVTAKGLKPAVDGNPQVLSTLDEIKVAFNGAPLTFVTIDNAKDYFPPTTITVTPLGETLKTDAPDVKMPVKLPGLDAKRFPDITYLPLQLPADGAEVGKSYSFSKAFGDSDVKYVVTPTKIAADAVEMDVALSQTYEVLENEGLEVVKEEKDAVSRVKTVVTGRGSAVFKPALGLFASLDVKADANSVVTDLQTKKTSERKLKTTLAIKLRKSG